MPRTKGAKNILNAHELKAELERLKSVSKTSETKISTNEAMLESDIAFPLTKDNKLPSKNKVDLTIGVPKRKKTETDKPESIKYRCGWKCGYYSDSVFDKCPKCGKENIWE